MEQWNISMKITRSVSYTHLDVYKRQGYIVMGMNLAYKILSSKLKDGNLVPGEQIGIQIDQTLTQDSTGTMAYLQLEAMNIKHVAVEKAVAYIDHNMLQTGFENMDDHEFIRSVAKKHGIVFSKPGNGVCHQLQLENLSLIHIRCV